MMHGTTNNKKNRMRILESPFLDLARRLKFLRHFKTRHFGSRLCFRLHARRT